MDCRHNLWINEKTATSLQWQALRVHYCRCVFRVQHSTLTIIFCTRHVLGSFFYLNHSFFCGFLATGKIIILVLFFYQLPTCHSSRFSERRIRNKFLTSAHQLCKQFAAETLTELSGRFECLHVYSCRPAHCICYVCKIANSSVAINVHFFRTGILFTMLFIW